VGLELPFWRIRDIGKVAVAGGIGQFLFTSLVGYWLCRRLDFTVREAFFLSTALTFSSTVVVVKLLDEKGERDRLYGRITVGIFLVQDLLAMLMLTFLVSFSSGVDRGWAAVLADMGKAFTGLGLLLGLAWMAARYLFRRPFAWAAHSPDLLFIWALAWCFALAWVADFFRLAPAVGAFLAGLSLAQLPFNEHLMRRVNPLMNLFLAVFFVTLGLSADVGGALSHRWSTLLLSLFVLIGNPLIFMMIIRWMGYSRRASFLASVTVAQISEFSFIFIGVGLSRGWLGKEILSITALVGMVTMAASAYMILYNHALHRFFERTGILKWWIFRLPLRRRRVARQANNGHAEPLEDHIIVVGMNSVGRKIALDLDALGETVLAVDYDWAKLEDLPVQTLMGSVEYLALLDEAGLERAKMLVSCLKNDDTNELLAYRCQLAKVPCSVHLLTYCGFNRLQTMGVGHTMLPKEEGTRLTMQQLRSMGILKS
jgi:Kef-type K+ transport system membrane component KefB